MNSFGGAQGIADDLTDPGAGHPAMPTDHIVAVVAWTEVGPGSR